MTAAAKLLLQCRVDYRERGRNGAMAAVASCCVNWLVPLRPAGAIAFTLLFVSWRDEGPAAPFLVSTHPHQYIRYDCQGDPRPSQRLKIETSISRRGCGIMVAGTRQASCGTRTEAAWKPAVRPSLEVELYISWTDAMARPELVPLPPGDSPPRNSDLKATRMAPRSLVEQASATRILHVHQFYDPPLACRW